MSQCGGKIFIALRAVFRLSRVALHLASGLFMVTLVYPCVTPGQRLALKQRWSRQLLDALGVVLKVGVGDTVSQTARPAGMLVANHISFLDIFVINAWAPAAFVAKEEVKQWPLVGWLSRRTDTIFLQRGSRQENGVGASA